jgi:hydrogenase maturation protease
VKVLVLGVGNLLKSDDGVGVRALQLISERYRFPDRVTLLDGGTLGLDLLPQLDGVERLVIIDAVDVGAVPGTVVRLTEAEIGPALEHRLSPHQLGVKELLAVSRLLGAAPAETVLLGVQPKSLALALELTAEVAAALEQLVPRVVSELTRWGITPGEVPPGG